MVVPRKENRLAYLLAVLLLYRRATTRNRLPLRLTHRPPIDHRDHLVHQPAGYNHPVHHDITNDHHNHTGNGATAPTSSGVRSAAGCGSEPS